MLSLHNSGVHEFKWIKFVQNIFNDAGLRYIFNSQGGIPFISYKLFLKQQLHDQFIQKWFLDVMNSYRGKFYSIFKKEFDLEKYLLRLPSHYSVWITKLRTSNLKFPIEVGRWYGIPKENRHCTLCLNAKMMLFLISETNSYLAIIVKTQTLKKMGGMFSNCHIQLLTNIAIFIKKICKLL
jgi:hypothetical protein